jgi:tripartite-type tricarboxylate transporter receptor subunit TctC
MDAAVVKKLDEAFRGALEDKDVLGTLDKFDMTARYMDSAAYDKFIRRLYVEEKQALEQLGLVKKA